MEKKEESTEKFITTKVSPLYKVYNSIISQWKQGVKINNIKEFEFLEEHCRVSDSSANAYIQTYQRLATQGVVPAATALTTLIAILPSSSSDQYYVIADSIISISLYDLQQRVDLLKPGKTFECPYGTKNMQHPFITLIQNGANMVYITEKIRLLCNHHDKEIRQYSIDFLKPVFLHILCNLETLPESRTIWSELLLKSSSSMKCLALIKNVLTSSKVSTSRSCFHSSIFVLDAIYFFKSMESHQDVIDLLLYLIVITNKQIIYGMNPEASIRCIVKILNTMIIDEIVYNTVLVLLSQTLHTISHLYISELLRIIFTIIVDKCQGNEYIRNMILDGLISWISQKNCVSLDELSLVHPIIEKIIEQDCVQIADDTSTEKVGISSNTRLYHCDVAIALDIVKLTTEFKQTKDKSVFSFIDKFNRKGDAILNKKLILLLRGMFLLKNISLDCWFKVYQLITLMVKDNEELASDFFMTFLFKLSVETCPEIQIELIRGLPYFAIAKGNIPTILKTINILHPYNGANIDLCMDLHLRLWKNEKRSYPFLLKSLSLPANKYSSEFQYYTVKASVIRNICMDNPSHHGADLIPHITQILNKCLSIDGDLPTAIAIEAITVLSQSNVVSAVSTWKELNGRFRQEKRPRAIKSILKFYSCIPSSCKLTVENEKLIDDILEQLWLTVDKCDNIDHTQIALESLADFEPGKHMFLRHLPKRFHIKNKMQGRQLDLDNEWDNMEPIPGECWLQLLRNINVKCMGAAADLIGRFIEIEVATFRGGIYDLSSYKPEQKKLSLRATSPLKAILNYIIKQSHSKHIDDNEKVVLINALRTVSRKFSKPIPPFDWNYLHSFFHINFEARKYCILITINQMQHSVAAKQLLENFLSEFEPNCFEEDLLFLMDNISSFSSEITLLILRSFTERVAMYCFKVSQINGFNEGCLFAKFLLSVRPIFQQTSETTEVSDMLISIIQRYMDSIDYDCSLFKTYTEVISTLHPCAIEALTSPSTWWEVSLEKLKRAAVIRCNLVLLSNRSSENPLKWLTPLIDVFMECTNQQTFLLQNLAITLYNFKDERNAYTWITDLLNRLQNLLVGANEPKQRDLALFLVDIMVLSIVSFSGYALLFGDISIVAESRIARREIFVQSLLVLLEKIYWRDNAIKLIDGLHQVFKNPIISEYYKDVFKEMIILSRNNPFLCNENIWMKYNELC